MWLMLLDLIFKLLVSAGRHTFCVAFPEQNLGAENVIPQSEARGDIVTAGPQNDDLLVWNPSKMTAAQWQGKFCPLRCNGSDLVSIVDSNRCLQCFPCTCDEDCEVYGTCCPQLKDSWYSPPIERAQCISVGPVRVLQAVTCDPAFPQNETRALCESKALPRRRDTVLPVTSIAKGVTYANRYCAQCHQDLNYSVQWTFTCLHDQFLYNVTNDTQYDDHAALLPDICSPAPVSSIPTNLFDKCNMLHFYLDPIGMISTCNVTGKWKENNEHVRKACEESDRSGGEAVTYKSEKYANVFCAMCNEQDDVLTAECTGSRGPDVYTFMDIVSFSQPPKIVTFTEEIDGCPVNQWKHPKDGCQELLCSAGKLPSSDHTCYTPVARVRRLGYRLRLLLRPVLVTKRSRHPPNNVSLPPSSGPPPTRAKRARRLGTCKYSSIINKAMKKIFDFYYAVKSVTITTAQTRNETCFYQRYNSRLKLMMKNETRKRHRLKGGRKMLKLRLDENRLDVAEFLAATVEVDIIGTVKHPRDAFEETALERIFQKEWNVSIKKWTVKLRALDLTSGLYGAHVDQGPDRDRLHVAYDYQHPLKGLEQLFLPLSTRLLCKHLSFRWDELEVKMSDKELQITFPFYLGPDMKPVSFNARDHPHTVWIEEDQALVMCFQTYLEVFPPNVTVVSQGTEEARPHAALSVVCNSLSLLCLALTLLTYSLFPELRSLPGLNNMGLCSSLAAAQLVMFTPRHRISSISPLCISAGVALHWLWLMAWLWMAICCVHMLRVFTAKTRHALTQRETQKAFLRNVLSTVVVSVGIVVLTMATSAAVSGGSSIGYGSGQCFLDTGLHPLLMLPVFLPLGAMVLTNFICFFITVVSIVRMRRLTAQVGSGRRDVLVYAKLATVTGAGWVLGLLTPAIRSLWMVVVAELCTGLQGLLLFLSFVCNARVRQLYRARCGARQQTAASTATSVTSPTTVKAQTADG
ncbi:uncharacterized protein LOC143281673 [Babylonia areolata]|uniref:uncharacterized protein LOC143281673 n=1 Tax=Babylonia areolata TaxID=304850 RepID=UPI003FCEF38B